MIKKAIRVVMAVILAGILPLVSFLSIGQSVSATLISAEYQCSNDYNESNNTMWGGYSEEPGNYTAGEWGNFSSGSVIEAGFSYADIYYEPYYYFRYKLGGELSFDYIAIPSSATITDAYLTLTCSWDSSDQGSVNTVITGGTATIIAWYGIGAWKRNSQYSSPNISPIINEIIHQEGWESGNSLTLSWNDFDDASSHIFGAEREAYSYGGAMFHQGGGGSHPEWIPTLHVTGIGLLPINPNTRFEPTVTLQGSARPTEGYAIQVTVKYFEVGSNVMGVPLFSETGDTDKVGSDAIINLPAPIGTYDVTIDNMKTLTNVLHNVTFIENLTLEAYMGKLLEGNCYHDLTINYQDGGLIVTHYSPLYTSQADFNEHGMVNYSDGSLFLHNYGLTSPVSVD